MKNLFIAKLNLSLMKSKEKNGYFNQTDKKFIFKN
jgi:hypothetical protein